MAAGLMGTSVLAACSSSGDNNKTTSGGGGGKGPIKIGVEIPTSGALASASTVYGLVAKALGTSKLPGTDTIDGRKVQIIIRDNQGTGPGSAAATRQLLDQDKVDAIIGPLYTTEALSALPLVKKAGVLEFALTGCPDCGDGTKYPTTFSVESDRPTQMPSTIARMQKAGVKKVAVLESDDPTGSAYNDAFKAAADKAGVTIATTVTFSAGALDLGSQAAQLKSSGADAVYLASAVPTDVANAAKAMKEIQYEPYVFGNAAAAVTVVVQAAGDTWIKKWAASGYGTRTTRPDPAPQDVTFANQVDAISPQIGSVAPIDLSAGVLDSFNMIKKAVEGTHSTDGKTLAKWLEGNGYADGLKADYKFTSTVHNGLAADQQSVVQPGTLQNGIPLRAGETG
ncbi:MAG TPA: ABC transporter substrate-binding protein [Frankiaceae bacterium]|nr:ABC transporter substrate-binding protein [Frankiaceae bacterium]